MVHLYIPLLEFIHIQKFDKSALLAVTYILHGIFNLHGQERCSFLKPVVKSNT